MDSRVVRGDLRMAGRVRRYACWPTLSTQTVSEHSWQVARVYASIFGFPNGDVAAYIQLHDVAELITGDAPFPVKAQNPDLKAAFDRVERSALLMLGVQLPAIEPHSKHRVKVCDLLEMTSFGMLEVEMGNRLAVPVVQRTLETVKNYAEEFLNDVDKRDVAAYILKEQQHHAEVMRGQREHEEATLDS